MSRLVDAWRGFVAGFQASTPDLTELEQAQLAGAPQEVNAEREAVRSQQEAAKWMALQNEKMGLQAQLETVLSKERASFLEGMKSEGKLLPSAEKAAATILAVGGETEQAFRAFLEFNGTVAAFRHDPSEGTSGAKTMDGAEAAAANDSKREDQALANLAAARSKKDGISYSAALAIVARENPGLVDSLQATLPSL